ncbi:MAG TPA: 4Fe-4S dicluster domain-containing protein [bacterium (Candidatus Stahlbacteria)]|nr:4Fe-4S dicluster domain-containing protein [Candidatus Stahlbacteria bacterium]
MVTVKDKECIGCGRCIQVCPTGAITIIRGKARINSLFCLYCFRCTSV